MATFATSNSELELAGDNILHMPTKDDLVRAAAKYYSPKAIAFDKARNMDDYVRPDGYIQTADAASLVVARRPTALPKRTAKKDFAASAMATSLFALGMKFWCCRRLK
ncbi:hypothetical protein ACFQAT_05800 [Undibacterium arcticum]|uniref:Uncharacterized protein n=1 Tax=Undibacterium arcticum TaxID=1762892 RepID=A0ABV7FAI0_9BURK